jgi:hypothetical protein
MAGFTAASVTSNKSFDLFPPCHEASMIRLRQHAAVVRFSHQHFETEVPMQATGISPQYFSPGFFPQGLAPQSLSTIGTVPPQINPQGWGAQSGPYTANGMSGPDFGAYGPAQQILAQQQVLAQQQILAQQALSLLSHLVQQLSIHNAVTQQIDVALHQLHQLAQQLATQTLYGRAGGMVGAVGQQALGGLAQPPFGVGYGYGQQQGYNQQAYGQPQFPAGVGQQGVAQQGFAAPWQAASAGQPFGAFGGQVAGGLPGLSPQSWVANRPQMIQ